MTVSITGKYKFTDESEKQEYFRYVKQYTSVVHILYRYLCRDTANGAELKEKNAYYKKGSDMLEYLNRMNNIELILNNEWFKHCAYYDAYDLITTCGRHVVFGGKNDFKDYIKGIVSKEQYLEQKLRPFYCIGTAKPYKGNQKFRLQKDLKTVVFQPSRDEHKEFMIYDIPYNQKKLLETIYEMQENKTLAVTYNLCPDGRLAIQYDVEKLCDNIIKLMNNRVFAVDLNPNYIGWVVIEWNSFSNYRIIDYGVESFKELNDLEDVLKEKLGKASTGRFHYTEKKEYETEFIAKKLINRAKHYLCSVVGLDGVNISTSNKNKGRFFNRLVNNKWLRTEFQNTYMKNAILCGMKVIDVPTPYTSVIGNFLYRHTGMPDMCLAAMEISRRSYRANRMNLSNFEMKKDMHILPDKNDFKEFFDKSCDEFKLDEKDRELTFKEIYKKYLKNKKYRVKLEDTTQNMKIIKHRKRYTAAIYSR